MVNLDTCSALAFVSEGSPVRHLLRAYVRGKMLVMSETANREFDDIVRVIGGPKEQARSRKFLTKITVLLDSPSPRALGLTPTRNLEPNDIIILGTGDRLGIVTLTSDQRAVRAAQAQGVPFQVYLHPPVPLTGS